MDREDVATSFRREIERSVAAMQALLNDLQPCIDVAEVLVGAFRRGNMLYLFGNGGSAADAQHIAAEFLGRFYLERPPMPAHALTVNTSALTAISNDYSFELVFARQLQALGRVGDVAVGISTSGNAPNVITGLRAARERGLTSVALTGESGGKARGESDYWVPVPTNDTPRIQECHILIGHIWSQIVEAELFGAPDGASIRQP